MRKLLALVVLAACASGESPSSEKPPAASISSEEKIEKHSWKLGDESTRPISVTIDETLRGGGAPQVTRIARQAVQTWRVVAVREGEAELEVVTKSLEMTIVQGSLELKIDTKSEETTDLPLRSVLAAAMRVPRTLVVSDRGELLSVKTTALAEVERTVDALGLTPDERATIVNVATSALGEDAARIEALPLALRGVKVAFPGELHVARFTVSDEPAPVTIEPREGAWKLTGTGTAKRIVKDSSFPERRAVDLELELDVSAPIKAKVKQHVVVAGLY